MKLWANGINLNYHDEGKGGPALVFLHHWGGSSRTSTGVRQRLSAKYRTIAIDLRGWGDSDAPEEGYSIVDMTNDVQCAMSVLRLERYVVVGHSMGGKVAQLLASRRPGGLAGLVLVAPTPAGGVQVPEEQRRAMLSAYDDAASVAGALDNVLTAGPLTAELRQQAIEDSLRGAPQAKRAWPTSGRAEDVAADIDRINVPTIVITGELDKIDPVPILQRDVVERIRGTRLEILSGAGHLLPMERPADLAQSIGRFVAQNVPS